MLSRDLMTSAPAVILKGIVSRERASEPTAYVLRTRMAELKARILAGEFDPVMVICPECGESHLERDMHRHREWHVEKRHQQHIREFISAYRSEKQAIEAEVGHWVADFYSTWLKGIGLSGWDADGNPLFDLPAAGYDRETIKAEARQAFERVERWRRALSLDLPGSVKPYLRTLEYLEDLKHFFRSVYDVRSSQHTETSKLL